MIGLRLALQDEVVHRADQVVDAVPLYGGHIHLVDSLNGFIQGICHTIDLRYAERQVLGGVALYWWRLS